MFKYLYVRKVALLASEGENESLLHGQKGQDRVPYFADNVFADQTEQYPEYARHYREPKVCSIIIHVTLYIFFWDFCFLYIKSTQQGG